MVMQMDTTVLDHWFLVAMTIGPWVLCLGALACICIGLWMDENRMRRMNRLASAIELSAEAWGMTARGDLTPTEYCQRVEQLYTALLREPDHISEEFHREIIEFPFYLVASLGAACRRVTRGVVHRMGQCVPLGKTRTPIEGSSVAAVGTMVIGAGDSEVS